MKVDAYLGELDGASTRAAALESSGYDGLVTVETKHDPFLPLAVAAEHTRRVDLITAIAVALARNPMTLANLGWDLQEHSKGRFVLGLGSQIRPHIEKRFGMPWSQPAPRMRELILAIRHIWEAWDAGTKLDFRGDFYTHTLMTPFFDPGPNPYGTPRIFLAAVGQQMTEVAAEVADGILLHALTNERYLREITMPAIERGLQRSGRRRQAFEISLPCFVISGSEESAMTRQRAIIRQQISFYASTPAYRPVLEVYGWGDLQTDLNRLSKQGRWREMAHLVDDSVLRVFAIEGAPTEIPGLVLGRYGDLVDRITFAYTTCGDDDIDIWSGIAAELGQGPHDRAAMSAVGVSG